MDYWATVELILCPSAAKMKQEDTFHKTFIFHSSETTTTNIMRL